MVTTKGTTMENHSAASGRKRGLTKNSIEDQALDQIAKEKIVNFGSGRTSNENSGDEDHSRPETPVTQSVGDDSEKTPKKRRGRSKKNRKAQDDVPDVIKKDVPDVIIKNNDDGDDEPVIPLHEIPDIFFEDLSETDKSKDGNSTSQDVSSSDLSENLPVERPGIDVDIWADRDDDDFVNSENAPEKVAEEPVNFDDFWAEFDEVEGHPRKSSRTEKSESCERSNDTKELDDKEGSVNDFWGEKKSGMSDKIEDKPPEEKEEEVEDIWADRQDDLPPVASEKLFERLSENRDDVNNLVSPIGSLPTESLEDHNIRSELSIESESNRSQSGEESNEIGSTKSDVRNRSRTREKSEVTLDSANLMESSKKENSSLNDEQDFQSLNDQEGENQNDQEDESQAVESFWGDAEDDIPPVLLLRPLEETKEELVVGPTAEVSKFDEIGSKTEEVSEDLSFDHHEDTLNGSSSSESDLSRESKTEESSPEKVTEITDKTEERGSEKKEISQEKRGSSEESSNSETQAEKEGAGTTHEVEDFEKTEIKEAHRRNFAKALQDIETPTRRRSVLLPESRERGAEIEIGSRPQPLRQRYVSESSTGSDPGRDDGIIDFLGKENDRVLGSVEPKSRANLEAEARLAARRQARVEAREIRMRELERVQKEQEETSDKVLDLHTTPPHLNATRQPSMSPRERPTSTNSYHSSRRSSEDSMEDGLSLRDIRHELKEVEEKFRKAMIANAQLDNEKAAHAYQVELLKDKLEDLEEVHSQLSREHREKCREHEALKRAAMKLKEDLTMFKMCLEERDRLIADYGLIIVGGQLDEKGEATPRALVSSQSAEVLESAGEGSLDVRLKSLANEKNELIDEVRHLKLELEEERNRRRIEQAMTNGPVGDEIQQTLNDYRFRLQKAEQDTSTLQATVARLESQVIRYKSAAEESEKAEDELKVEKRKLLREHRESIARIEELETSNSHLQRRMDKLKNAKSTLLKEL